MVVVGCVCCLLVVSWWWVTGGNFFSGTNLRRSSVAAMLGPMLASEPTTLSFLPEGNGANVRQNTATAMDGYSTHGI